MSVKMTMTMTVTFVGERKISSLKAFGSRGKTVKFINHLMGRIKRESVRVSTHIHIFILYPE